mmetsp:Transcript_6732/g.21750  ORF Transcript_6732/g.21750 Transcript_6732/m.21750 type:complete len:125 (-) Transcript_6732:437-811(-)
MLSDRQAIGLFFCIYATGIAALGVALGFDSGLLALAHVIGTAGVVTGIGFGPVLRFAIVPTHIPGIATCTMGAVLVLVAQAPVLGLLLEVGGIVLLFGTFIPRALRFALFFVRAWSLTPTTTTT